MAVAQGTRSGYQGSSQDDKVATLVGRMTEGVKAALESPEKWQALLKHQSVFHHYSWGNQLLIMLQRPTATQVAGYQTWLQLKRQVQRGEKGISILAPIVIKVKHEHPDTGEVSWQRVLKGFRSVAVFDVAQTVELPGAKPLEHQVETPQEMAGRVARALSDLWRYGQDQGLTMTREDLRVGHHGYYQPFGRKIAISTGISDLQVCKTTVHELAHSILHPEGYDAGDNPKPREVAELEAESTAFVVMAALGLETEELSWLSFGYVAHWNPDPQVVMAAGERIAKAARTILEGVGHREQAADVA